MRMRPGPLMRRFHALDMAEVGTLTPIPRLCVSNVKYTFEKVDKSGKERERERESLFN